MDAKTESTADQFATDIECAKKAGIYENMFLSFGSLLGFCRDDSICPNDDDMDVGFLFERITVDQEKAYVAALESSGCYRYRRKYNFNPVSTKLFWTSIRKHPGKICFKSCHWFWFKHKGLYWHHKGGESLIKGIPEKHLELGDYVEFLGSKIRIPKHPGKCLDFWYPNWMVPKRTQSAPTILMTVKSWANKKTWDIKI